MSRRRMALCLVAGLVLAPPGAAQDKPPAPPAANEALPAGAVARLGRPRATDEAQGHTARASALAFSPDGKLMATAGHDNTVRLWDAAAGKELHRMKGHTAGLYYVAFAPDGKTVASGSGDGAPRLWDVATGKEVRRLDGNPGGVFGVAFSPDGKVVAAGGFDGLVRTWDAATGKELRKYEGLGSAATAVVYSPDGKALMAGSGSGTLALWDTASGKELRRFTGHKSTAYPIALSADGKTLASGSYDGTVRVWETATGKQRRLLDGPQVGTIYALTISPDGRTLASASDGVVKLWEAATGRSRGRLEGHGGTVFRLAFSPDGKRLASCGDDHTALVWDLTRAAREPKERLALKPPELEASWDALAKPDAEAAYSAVVRLTAVPGDALPFLAKQLKADKPREGPNVARLIADLDDDSFDVREKASAALEKVGARAVPDLQRTLRGSPSAEVRRRVEDLLAKLTGDDRAPDERRLLRAVEVLEGVGTAEARKMLEELAKAPPTAEVGEEAKASLGRLKGR